jgi:hypothetical protein
MDLNSTPIVLNAALIQPEYSVATLAEIFVAIGTIALAVATYWSTLQGNRQIKRDRITKEMDLLILPLLIAFREINSRGVESEWWNLYYSPMRTMTNPVAAQRFRDAVKSIEQYRYLAPEKLRRLIDEFLLRLRDMERGKDSGNIGDFQQELVSSTKKLYYSINVEGGLVEQRSYELTKELDTLNKSFISKIHDSCEDLRKRIRRKRNPPLLTRY